MIVQCPSCASRYRIRDANIPPTGGKIRCPSCSHSFIVYPEANEDEDRTSITSQGEISHLVDQMDSQKRPAPADEDYIATQVAGGEELDHQRAMEAIRNELGDPMDMDGTVEIQNPMEVWKEAQAALSKKRAAGDHVPPPDDTNDDYDHAATEIVDPDSVKLPFRDGPATIPTPAVGGEMAEQSDPTFQMDQEAINALDPQKAGDSSPGVDPAGRGSGMHPYAQNTPPSGRNASNSGYDSSPGRRPPPVPGSPGSGSSSFDQPPVGRGPTDSGLQASDLFGEDDLDAGLPTVTDEPTAVAGEGPDPNHDGPWKLKTNFGLTYEFPDTRGLRSWLSSREELDGYQVSHDDGQAFYALDRYPQLDRNNARGPLPSGNHSVPSRGSGLNRSPTGSGEFTQPDSAQREPLPSSPGTTPAGSGLNPRPPTGSVPLRGPKVNTEYRPPSRENKYKGLLWLVFCVLLVVAVGIGVQTFGIYDVKAGAMQLLGQTPEQDAPEIVPSPDEAGKQDGSATDPELIRQRQQQEVDKLLEDAERLKAGNKLQSALEKLQTTVKIAPDNPRVHDMLADVHERLGEADKSAAAAARAEELRAAGDGLAGEGTAEKPDAGIAQPSESEETTE